MPAHPILVLNHIFKQQRLRQPVQMRRLSEPMLLAYTKYGCRWMLGSKDLAFWIHQHGYWKETILHTVKPALRDHSKIDKAKHFMTNGSLMKVKSIAECSPWSFLQYFWPALSDNWSWKTIFGLLWEGVQWLSGRVLDSRPKGRGFEFNRCHCLVSLSKTLLSLLSTGSTQEEVSWHN